MSRRLATSCRGLILAMPLLFLGAAPPAAPPAADCSFPLRSAQQIGEPAFERALYAFLEGRCYEPWVHDPLIRDTGPFLDNKNFGTHPAVKVYYSPEVWTWLKVKNRQGAVLDGSMIVKEMYPPPAGSSATLEGWTVMVKDAASSFDGWYWSYHAPGETPNAPIDYPESGFGLYCLRCHASAESELTFASVRNVEGDPLTFQVQEPTMAPEPARRADLHGRVADAGDEEDFALRTPKTEPSPEFLALYGLDAKRTAEPPVRFPPETDDHVVPTPGRSEEFVTSDQCLGCHSASSVNMAYFFEGAARPPVNLSPYTEWRASMMGLAGRDPVFHAQIEGERARFPTRAEYIDQTCFTCHGVLGRRQIELDGAGPFRHEMVLAEPGEPGAKYGALARDGVSCAACHHVAAEGLGTLETFTGKFAVGPPDEIYGPFEDVVTRPMEQALGITPKHAPQISSSALCGSCHTVVLPVLDAEGNEIKTIYEQSTYPEWLNSVYQNERAPVAAASVKTCQDCHMPRTYHGRDLEFRIANVEDASYPAADHRAPDSEITPVPRDDYARHMLMGINLFALSMFEQFPDVLGIRTIDYMYSDGVPGLVTARNSAQQLAETETAEISIPAVSRRDGMLDATVRVVNLAGHGLPTGVEFRRVWIELTVTDAAGALLWASGRTSPLGVILDGRTDQPLATEFMKDPASGAMRFQPHHEVITREDQVQIYEELVADPEGNITTSFFALDRHVKENRLQPKGWRADGPYAEVTAPFGNAKSDPEYRDGSGSDAIRYRIPLAAIPGAARVQATLWYQALPPYYLRQRFEAGTGESTQRLAHLASRLALDATPIRDWKLKVVSTSRELEPRVASRAAR